MPRLVWLEDRTLLAGTGPGADVVNVPAEALRLPLGAAVSGRIAPLGANYYEVSSSQGGELKVTLQSPGFPARISIVDDTGQPLVQSDETSACAGVIDENIPAGIDFLEVQSLGPGGIYQIMANLVPTDPAFNPVESPFKNVAPIGVGEFFGNGAQDLVAPDGIHVGLGNGTFESDVIDGPLGDSGWHVTAIAVGIFGSSGLPDIAFAETSPDRSTAKVCVLQNQGEGQFVRVDTFVVSPHPDAIATMDLGNGIVDLAVADQFTGAVATFLGDGSGSFTPGPVLPGGADPVALAAGQFGDGGVDLVVADQGDSIVGEGPQLIMFQDKGAGQFRQSATIPLGATPSALAVGDFGDGHLDLAIANDLDDDVSVLMGNGNGTFSTTVSTYDVGVNPVSVVACSLRGNGILDLVTVNRNSDDISVLVGNGDGTFQPQIHFAAGSMPDSLVEDDFNGDGRPDLAVGDLGSGEISVLLGRGDGTFQDQLTNPVGDEPLDAVTADLNHDGHPDIITSNYASNDVSVLLGNGDGTFQPAESFPAGDAPVGLVVGDFNGDGRIDVAIADGGDTAGDGEGVSILLGNGDGTFQSPVFYPTGTIPSAIVAGDFTGNGVIDLAVADLVSDEVTVLIGDGRGGFSVQPAISIGDTMGGPVAIAAGDFTGAGVLDLAVANEATDTVSVLQGNGHGGFPTSEMVSLGGDPLVVSMSLVAGDFTGGTLSDLAVATASVDEPDSVSIIPGSVQGAFAVSSTISLGFGVSPSSITTGHFFAGGPLDLAVADTGTDQVSLLQGEGTGTFDLLSTAIAPDSDGSPIVVATGDFTDEGEDDLAIVLQNPNRVAIELNQGNGTFVQPNALGLVTRNTPVVADFTGDGVPDVAIVDGDGDILFRQGIADEPGAFEPPVTINAGDPLSRDITAVVTPEGTLLASVNADDDAVSLFQYLHGQFHLVSSLATGSEPAQVVAADLTGTGDDDLIIRDAGDGTLVIYMSSPPGIGFLPAIVWDVGTGISDVSTADLSAVGPATVVPIDQESRPDILLTNQTSGLVDVIMNLGDGNFSQPTLYRAGVGLSAVVAGDGTTPTSLFSQDGTVGVAAATLTSGAAPDLVALDSGAETLGILTGLGDGEFANPYSLPPSGPTAVVRAADFTGNGSDDLAILGSNGVTILMGNGAGGIVQGKTYDVGPDPTGLTIADLYGNNVPDLVVGDAFGDILVLQGRGDGTFQQPSNTDQSVTFAVTYPAGGGGGAPSFVFSDQAKDQVVLRTGSGTTTVLADRTTGLLVPGQPLLADLTGNGIDDLIFVNTGGNSVIVRPGLPGGGFGPAVNDGLGFPTGTSPVAVIAESLTPGALPDLLIADRGSNSVSVLINESEGNHIQFAPGPRLKVGQGPDALSFGDFYGNGSDQLAVSDSGSNNVMLLQSLGGGYFNDEHPTIIPLSESPGPLVMGDFGVQPGLDLVTLDTGTALVTLISGLSTDTPLTQDFPSGGLDPDAAIAVPVPNAFDDLVVANGTGGVALLAGGLLGLTVAGVNHSLVSPTGLFPDSTQNNTLEVFASAAGEESTTLLAFSLIGAGGSNPGLALLSLDDSAFPLISTLLTSFGDLNAPESADSAPSEGAAAVATIAATATSLGQGPLSRSADALDESADEEVLIDPDVTGPAAAETTGLSPWKRIEIGLDQAFEEFRRALQRNTPAAGDGGGGGGEENPAPELAPAESPSASAQPVDTTRPGALVDAAIASISATRASLRAFGRDVRAPLTKMRVEPDTLNALLQVGIAMVPARPAGHLFFTTMRRAARVGRRPRAWRDHD